MEQRQLNKNRFSRKDAKAQRKDKPEKKKASQIGLKDKMLL
jgi:hypothetical protein